MVESGDDIGFVAVARHLLPVDLPGPVLAAHRELVDCSGRMGRMARSTSTFLLRISLSLEGNGRLHGNQAQMVQQVVLHHVAQGPGMLVVARRGGRRQSASATVICTWSM